MKYDLERFIDETREYLEYIGLVTETLNNPEHSDLTIYNVEKIEKMASSVAKKMRRKINETKWIY